MNLSFSSLILYKMLFFALLLFIFFRAVIIATPTIIKNKKYKMLFIRYLPIIEFLVWLLFSIWVFKNLLEKNQYFALVMFVVMLTIAIFSVKIFLKDYIAGIIVKADNSINLGNLITISGFSGIINKFNYRTLELELDNKKLIKIPYTKILNSDFIKEEKSNVNNEYKFEITTSKNKNIEELVSSIKQTIILLPWSSNTKDAVVEVVNETNNTYNLAITIFTHKKEMYYKIEKYIKDKFSI